MTATLSGELAGRLSRLSRELYQHGWAENHAGNITYRLDDDEAEPYRSLPPIKEVPLGRPLPALAGGYFLATAAGSPLRLVADHLDASAGVGRVSSDGAVFECLTGFEGSLPTSELPAHLRGHEVLHERGSGERAIMHCHPTHIVALTHLLDLSSEEMSLALWRTNSESILAFPRGVRVLPWMVCGTDEIGDASAEEFRNTNVVVWSYHGVLAAGRTLENVLELVESVEKAAQTVLLVHPAPARISDDDLRGLCARFAIEVPPSLRAT